MKLDNLMVWCAVLGLATQAGCLNEKQAGDGVFVPRSYFDSKMEGEEVEDRADQLLLTVATDAKPGKHYELRVRTGAGTATATGLVFVTPDGNYEYSLAGLQSGIVMMEEEGYQVIVLSSADFIANGGGNFKINYLVSAISGNRRTFWVEADLNGGVWEAYVNDSAGRRKISSLFFHANKFLGKVVGISRVTAQ